MHLSFSLTHKEVTTLQLIARGAKWGEFSQRYKSDIGEFAKGVVLAIIRLQHGKPHLESLEYGLALDFITNKYKC